MALVEKNFAYLFKPVVQRSNYFYESRNITVKDFEFTNFNSTNRTVDMAFKFDDPNVLGLNTKKSDHLMFFFNESYPWMDLLEEDSRRELQSSESSKPLQTVARARIELTFDYQDEAMKSVTKFSYFIMIGFAVFLGLQLLIDWCHRVYDGRLDHACS